MGTIDRSSGSAQALWNGNQCILRRGEPLVLLSAFAVSNSQVYQAYAIAVEYVTHRGEAASVDLTWNLIVDDADSSIFSAILCRPEVVDLGEVGCETAADAGCQYIFSQ